jgi:hypothetical protein
MAIAGANYALASEETTLIGIHSITWDPYSHAKFLIASTLSMPNAWTSPEWGQLFHPAKLGQTSTRRSPDGQSDDEFSNN